MRAREERLDRDEKPRAITSGAVSNGGGFRVCDLWSYPTIPLGICFATISNMGRRQWHLYGVATAAFNAGACTLAF